MTAIDDKFAALGGEASFLGAPTGAEAPTPTLPGSFRHYGGGSIYYSAATGAHEVHGAIRQKWASLGWERSFLRFPITDETGTPDGIGRFNHFEGGSIYWTPTTGAHEVHGAIRELWAENGWETRIGYPITDEVSMRASLTERISSFQRGVIGWSSGLGPWLDFIGNGQGYYQGFLDTFSDANLQGRYRGFLVGTRSPFLFVGDLITEHVFGFRSARLRAIPSTCSVYFYSWPHFQGWHVRATGRRDTVPVLINNMPFPFGRPAQSVQVVNHGWGSVLLSSSILAPAIMSAMGAFMIPTVIFTGACADGFPESRTVMVNVRGTIPATVPVSDLSINFFFRPFVVGPLAIRVSLVAWNASFGGSFAGYANSTISASLNAFLNDPATAASLETAFNRALSDGLAPLGALPPAVAEAVNVRRVNIIPEGMEIVLTDVEVGATYLRGLAGGTPGLSTSRPSGHITSGP